MIVADQRRLFQHYAGKRGKVFQTTEEIWTTATNKPMEGVEYCLGPNSTFILLSTNLVYSDVLVFKILFGDKIRHFRINKDYFEDDCGCELFREIS